MAPAAAFDVGGLRVATRIYTNVAAPRALVAEELDERLRAAGRPLTPRAYGILQVIAASSDGVTLDAVAGYLALSLESTWPAVERLARDGLLAAEPSGPDRRRRVTEAGRALVARVPGPGDAGRFAHSLEALAPTDVQRLAEQLDGLLRGLQPHVATLGHAPGASGARFALWLACVRVWRIARAEQTRFMAARTDGALEAASYQALYRIHELRSTVGDVAAFLRVDERAGRRFVERLEASGFVARARDSLTVTARGRELLEAVPPFDPAGRFARVVAELPEGGRQLDDVLQRLIYAFGAAPTINLAGFDALLDRIRAHHERRQRPAVDRDEFRSTMAEFPTGVALVTIGHGDARRGITVNSLTSVSLDPPLILVCFDRRSPALERLKQSRAFAVNLLTAEQQSLAVRFGRRETRENPHSLDEGMWSERDGVPVLVGALAAIVCEIEETFEAGSHTIVLASPRCIVSHESRAGVAPLGFWRSRYFPVRGPDAKEAGG